MPDGFVHNSMIKRPKMLLLIATVLFGVEYLASARRSQQRKLAVHREAWVRRLEVLCPDEPLVQ